jgi:proline racemase
MKKMHTFRSFMRIILTLIIASYINTTHAETDAAARCSDAQIESRSPCGTGLKMWVENRRNDKRVRVTIRKSWTGNSPGSNQSVVTLPAGGERELGCTQTIPPSIVGYSWSIRGCETLP